jgi:hypothetical protein
VNQRINSEYFPKQHSFISLLIAVALSAGFVVDGDTESFLRIRGFTSVSIIPPVLRTHRPLHVSHQAKQAKPRDLLKSVTPSGGGGGGPFLGSRKFVQVMKFLAYIQCVQRYSFVTQVLVGFSSSGKYCLVPQTRVRLLPFAFFTLSIQAY